MTINTQSYPTHNEGRLNTTNNVGIRIASILSEANVNHAISILLKIVNESALRQVHMIGLNEDEKMDIKNNLIPKLGSLIKIFESNDGEIKNNNDVHGYLISPDIDNNISPDDYMDDLMNPEKTHIGIYLWRIPNKAMLLKTLNHELNHLFLRYSICNAHRNKGPKSLDLVFNKNKRFPIILECLGFLAGAEIGIISGGFTQKQGLESAEEGSNGDLNDRYTIASILAKRILEIQLYFGNKVGNTNPDFIKYCQLIRYNLNKSIYDENKFEELTIILNLNNTNFLITNITLNKILDWSGM